MCAHTHNVAQLPENLLKTEKCHAIRLWHRNDTKSTSFPGGLFIHLSPAKHQGLKRSLTPVVYCSCLHHYWVDICPWWNTAAHVAKHSLSPPVCGLPLTHFMGQIQPHRGKEVHVRIIQVQCQPCTLLPWDHMLGGRRVEARMGGGAVTGRSSRAFLFTSSVTVK